MSPLRQNPRSSKSLHRWRGIFTFGLIPAVPNGGLDMLHPMGLQGTLRAPISSSLNVNIPRQRCRAFEERGFCLRGDMCPMEHGVNRIVIEDVQVPFLFLGCFLLFSEQG